MQPCAARCRVPRSTSAGRASLAASCARVGGTTRLRRCSRCCARVLTTRAYRRIASPTKTRSSQPSWSAATSMARAATARAMPTKHRPRWRTSRLMICKAQLRLRPTHRHSSMSWCRPAASKAVAVAAAAGEEIACCAASRRTTWQLRARRARNARVRVRMHCRCQAVCRAAGRHRWRSVHAHGRSRAPPYQAVRGVPTVLRGRGRVAVSAIVARRLHNGIALPATVARRVVRRGPRTASRGPATVWRPV
eukprot:366166-Chlamydomonas_euryale.AAC.19